MKYLLTLALLGIVIAGCSSQPNADKSGKEISPNNPDIADKAPEDRIIEEATPGEAGPSLPVMTASSPAIILTPIQGNTPEPSAANSARIRGLANLHQPHSGSNSGLPAGLVRSGRGRWRNIYLTHWSNDPNEGSGQRQ